MYPFLLGYPKITELLTFVCTVRNSKNESHINQNILEPGKKKKKYISWNRSMLNVKKLKDKWQKNIKTCCLWNLRWNIASRHNDNNTQQNWQHNSVLLFSGITNQATQRKFPHLERGEKKCKETDYLAIPFRNLVIIVHFILFYFGGGLVNIFI